MNRLLIVLTLFVFVVVGASCSFQCGKPSEESTSAPGPIVKAPATPAPTPDANAGKAGNAKVAVLKIGDQIDQDEQVTHAADTFAKDTAAIYASVGIKGLNKGDEIKGTLMATEVVTTDGTKVRDEEVASTTLASPAEESTAHFKFTPPEKGWPVGSYALQIAVNGENIDSTDLSVK